MGKQEIAATETPLDLAQVAKPNVWQSPEMEIVQIAATASGRGALCEGSVFTNTS